MSTRPSLVGSLWRDAPSRRRSSTAAGEADQRQSASRTNLALSPGRPHSSYRDGASADTGGAEAPSNRPANNSGHAGPTQTVRGPHHIGGNSTRRATPSHGLRKAPSAGGRAILARGRRRPCTGSIHRSRFLARPRDWPCRLKCIPGMLLGNSGHEGPKRSWHASCSQPAGRSWPSPAGNVWAGGDGWR
jgi:hypothetical protein